MSFKGLQIADTAFLARASPAIVLPSDFAGLIRWYKADSFSLADGDDVGGTGREWIDQSPAAPNDAVQATAGNRPVFKTNIFGSLPAIRFFDDYLTMNGAVLSGDFTVISIALGYQDSVIFGSTSQNIWIRLHVATGAIDYYDAINSIQSDAFSAINMASWRRDAAGNYTFRERNISRGSFAGSVVSKTWGLIGGTIGSGVSNCDIGELCMWNTRLSDADIDSLYLNYFKGRFGLA